MCLLLLLLLLRCCSLYLEIRVGRCGRLRLTSSNCQCSTRTSVRCKDLGDICCTSRGIAHFVINFVAMATKVGWGKIRLTAFDVPFPKTSLQVQKFKDISYTSRVIANFIPNFVAMATGGRPRVNIGPPRKLCHKTKNYDSILHTTEVMAV